MKKIERLLKDQENIKKQEEQEIDYYGCEADYIHLKFGDARKNFFFTSDFIAKYPIFAKEYVKYIEFNDKAQFQNPFQIVHYAYQNNIPVHFYHNYTDTPAIDEKEIMEYLVREQSFISELK